MAIFAQFEVAMPDDPKIIEAGDLAELVYYRAVMRCRDHLTDGVIDKRVLTRWFGGIRGKTTTHLARLVEVGLLQEHTNGWCIPPHVWGRRNPLKSEVEQKRNEEAARKADYRARKQAERGDVPPMSQWDDGTCPEVVPDLSHDAIDIDIARGIARDIDRDASSSELTPPGDAKAEDDGFITKLAVAIATQRANQKLRDPGARRQFIDTTVANLLRTEADTMRAFVADRAHMRDASLELAAQVYDAVRNAS